MKKELKEKALQQYAVKTVVNKYMDAVACDYNLIDDNDSGGEVLDSLLTSIFSLTFLITKLNSVHSLRSSGKSILVWPPRLSSLSPPRSLGDPYKS